MILGLAIFLAIFKVFEIVHDSTSSIFLFCLKNISFSFYLTANLAFPLTIVATI